MGRNGATFRGRSVSAKGKSWRLRGGWQAEPVSCDTDQHGRPRPERLPVSGELLEFVSVEGPGSGPIEMGGVEGQSRFLKGEAVGGPGGAKEDERRISGADTGKLSQGGKRFIRSHLDKIRRV